MLKNSFLSILAILALCVLTACNGDDYKPGGKKSTPEDDINAFLIAHYTFDSGNALDMSGNGWDGVVFNNAGFISDTPSGTGSALFLNGIKEQYVNIPYNMFAGLLEYTISLWVKDFSTGALVSGISSQFEVYCVPRVYLKDDGTLSFETGYNDVRSSQAFAYNCSSIQSGSWHHIAVTVARDNSTNYSYLRKLYIDGILTDSIQDYSKDNAGYVTKFNIGGNGNGFYPVFQSMKVDNVSFFSAALKGTVVKYLYDNKF